MVILHGVIIMKFRYLLFTAVYLLIIVFLSGCAPKAWIYDFPYENSLVRGDEAWRPYQGNYYFNDGLVLNEEVMGAPHYYDGDFTVSVDFDLNVSTTDLGYFEVFLSTSKDIDDADWYGGVFIPKAGSTASSMTLFYWPRSSWIHEIAEVPVDLLLNNNGANNITLDKKGDFLKYSVNGTPIAVGMLILECDSDMFCPFIGCFSANPENTVFKTVKIEYQGDQVLID